MKGCVFAGTFDPITVGHQNVIEKCLKAYGKVLVVVGKNPKKTCAFTEKDRLDWTKRTFKDYTGVEVIAYSQIEGEYADYLKEKGYLIYARGIRDQKDLEMENAYKDINAKIYPFVTTEYVYPDERFATVSSSMVKQKMILGQDYLEFIPQPIRESVKEKAQEVFGAKKI
ncbi:MAG: pantetheine-phosphate adenylyltransferase [Clostridia bacterium]|nr:pantetheine-phosphate adenylyltransferase [Clostridia bacterium]